jgi:hypothetical protein
MSVIVYGPGGTKLVEAQDLACALKGDWYLSREEIPNETLRDKEVPKKETKKIAEVEDQDEEKPLKRLNLDAMSEDDIRVTAKELKIPNWWSKGIERLKGEISAA